MFPILHIYIYINLYITPLWSQLSTLLCSLEQSSELYCGALLLFLVGTSSKRVKQHVVHVANKTTKNHLHSFLYWKADLNMPCFSTSVFLAFLFPLRTLSGQHPPSRLRLLWLSSLPFHWLECLVLFTHHWLVFYFKMDEPDSFASERCVYLVTQNNTRREYTQFSVWLWAMLISATCSWRSLLIRRSKAVKRC